MPDIFLARVLCKKVSGTSFGESIADQKKEPDAFWHNIMPEIRQAPFGLLHMRYFYCKESAVKNS
ncbi:MAG: hypothetical protein A3I05_10050 [Deltaproteobacteria bacterium RIFCSPLOWO2_02_FULL_44_10]|nr:MAG: hypothetical protein A3I05_10050 [Deltaproteobacteria bacterium RIFCSPLOWO2_02_FULL_44_10]